MLRDRETTEGESAKRGQDLRSSEFVQRERREGGEWYCETLSNTDATSPMRELIYIQVQASYLGVHAVPVPDGPDVSVCTGPYPCRSGTFPLPRWMVDGTVNTRPQPSKVRPSRPSRRLDGYL